MTSKICLVCERTFEPRPNESPSNFRVRRYCGRPCYAVAMRGRKWSHEPWVPDPEEIRARCEAIQAEWSDHTESIRRAVGQQRAEVIECQIVTSGD